MTDKLVFFAFAAFIISFVSILIIIKLSHKFEIYDSSCSRKIHTGNIPRLGGLGIFIAFFPLAIISMKNSSFSGNYYLLIAGMLIASSCGFIDDFVRIRGRYKLLIQVVAASCVAASGLLITDFRIYTLIHVNFGILSYPITVFWILAFMNAVNLIDGMDGLSTGIFLIANLFLIIISWLTGNTPVLLLSVILECSILGFYVLNFPPARIFLGDGGAYFIGFMYAVFPLMGLKKSAALTAFLIPMILMLVPIMDVAIVMYKRLKTKKNMFHPDKNHIHHRLMNLGFSVKGILGVTYSYTAILGIFSLIMVSVQPEFSIILLGFILMMLGLSFFILAKAEKVIAELKAMKSEKGEIIPKPNMKLLIFRRKIS